MTEPSNAVQQREAAPRRRWERWIFAFALATVGVVSLGYASLAPFWYDELVTVHASDLGSAHAIVDFFQGGKDTTSFLPPLLVYALPHTRGRLEVTSRLPFLAAYLGACWFLYAFVRRRYSAGYALAATMLFALGYSFGTSYEIRAYGFVLLGTTMAAFFWQRAPQSVPRRGLAALGIFAGLGIAIAFHLFAVFLLIPFAVAQCVQEVEDWRSGQGLRWGIWLALAAAPCFGVLEVRGALAAKRVYGPSFWSKPDLHRFLETYAILLNSTVDFMGILLVMLAVMVWLRKSGRLDALRQREGATGPGFSAPEWTLQFGFLFLPMAVAVLSVPLGAFRARYVLAFFAGAATLLAALAAECMRRSTTVGWTAALCLLVAFVANNWAAAAAGAGRLTGRRVQRWEFQMDWYAAVKKIDLPVVVDNSPYFLQMDYYGPAGLKSRMYYLTSRPRAEKYPWCMTSELNMEIFAADFKLPVRDFDSFTRANPKFLLVVEVGQAGNEWILHYLVAEIQAGHGVRLTRVAQQQGLLSEDVYLVEMKPDAK